MVNHENAITLIGAGLVGSLLAVLLAKRGFRVIVFERRPDMRTQDISAGRSINLALANRGIYPLEQAGLMEQVKSILTPMKGRMVHDQEGRQSFQSYGQKLEEVIYSVSRGELNKICMDAAEATGLVTIYFNQKCESVDLEAQTLSLHDEVTGKISLQNFKHVIGTDGSASAVRESIHRVVSKQNNIIPLGHGYKELNIPAGSNGEYQLDPNALHIWPRGGYMVIALPNEDHSFTVTLFMPNEGEISFANIDTPEKVTRFFEQHFKNILPLLPNLNKEYFENPTGRLATIKCSPWHYTDRALIIGDAAHAIVPFHGQGMNCGFEDALCVVETIDKLGTSWQDIFRQVDDARKNNGDAIADMAIENYVTMRDSVRDEKFLLKSSLAFELENRFPEYFCPRYSMVMFHRLPYAEAKTRGYLQENILEVLTNSTEKLDNVDFELAENLIKQKLSRLNLNPNS